MGFGIDAKSPLRVSSGCTSERVHRPVCDSLEVRGGIGQQKSARHYRFVWRIFVAEPPAHEDPQLRPDRNRRTLCRLRQPGGGANIVPVQAEGGPDILGVIQTIQDITFCQTERRYKNCIPRTVTSASGMPPAAFHRNQHLASSSASFCSAGLASTLSYLRRSEAIQGIEGLFRHQHLEPIERI